VWWCSNTFSASMAAVHQGTILCVREQGMRSGEVGW